MLQFTEDFNNKRGKILIEHALWGKQVFRCDTIEMIDDTDRLGVKVNGHDVYIMKGEMISCKYHDRMLMFADKSLTITIIVNKL